MRSSSHRKTAPSYFYSSLLFNALTIVESKAIFSCVYEIKAPNPYSAKEPSQEHKPIAIPVNKPGKIKSSSVRHITIAVVIPPIIPITVTNIARPFNLSPIFENIAEEIPEESAVTIFLFLSAE